jgi:RNA polymerase sigma-70 factor, ECF subfamily
VLLAQSPPRTEPITIPMSHPIDDLALRRALATNLDGCFEQLVMHYQERMFAFALRIAGNRQDAEEIAQDTFVRAYRALAGYGTVQIETLALRAWLYQIALNVFRNRVRGHRLQLVPLDDDDGAPLHEPAGDEREQPALVYERAERRRELGAIVAALPERYRVAVVLRHIEGFGYGEAAALLGQPVGTVKSNVHRGVELLRKALADAAPEREL